MTLNYGWILKNPVEMIVNNLSDLMVKYQVKI